MREIEIKQIHSVGIKPFFESLTEEELTSEEFLTEFLLKMVGVGFRGRDFAIKEGGYLPSKGFKMKIWPDELAKFLLFMYRHKEEINSYLELGTGSGGTFYVIDSYLRTINPNMGRSDTVDQREANPFGFDEYKRQNSQVDYFGNKIRNFEVKQSYDLCFIDANHKYGEVKHDYEKIKDYCKFIAFHDIVTVNPKKPEQRCVRHLWQELKAENKIEMITSDPRISFMSGIGVSWN